LLHFPGRTVLVEESISVWKGRIIYAGAALYGEGERESMKGKKEMEPDDLLCSRNARSQTPLVERAQWKINQPPSRRDNERVWKDHLYRSTRAFEDQPGRPLRVGTSKLGGSIYGLPRARWNRSRPPK
jgi:hypothetical protein